MEHIAVAEVVRLEDLAGLDHPMDRPSVVKRLRDHHHLVARLVAEGRRTNDIAAEVGLSVSRVSILKGDPSFQQLVEMYRMNYNQLREAAFADVQKKLALLEANAIDGMNERYEDEPENISHEQMRADAEFASDRLGRGKISKNVNFNVSQPLAEVHEQRRLRADRLSAQALPDARDRGSDASPTPGPEDPHG
jgi:hypothetical protein